MDGLNVRVDVSLADFVRVMLAASGSNVDDEMQSLIKRHYDLDIAFGAFYRGRLVGTVGLRHLTLTMPGGGRLRVVGIGQGGVLPDFTRRGVLKELMKAALRYAKDIGAALSIATTTGWGLYGRYGYGPATMSADYVIPGSPEVVDIEEALNCEFELSPLKDEVVPWLVEAHGRSRHRPGAVLRTSGYWRFRCAILGAGRSFDLSDRRQTYTNAFVVRCLEGTQQTGAALYEIRESGHGSHSVRSLTVHDLMAESAGAEANLWRYLLGIDLVDEISVPHSPIDLSPRWILRDGRLMRCIGLKDHMWIRVIDIDRCLEARTFVPTPYRMTVRIVDPLDLTSTSLLKIGPSGVRVCNTESDGSDSLLTITVGDLGSLLMGADVLLGRLRFRNLAEFGEQLIHAFTFWREPFADSQF